MAELIVQTSRFGEIVVSSDRVIRFLRPIIGFEHLSQYAMLDHKENSPFRWLQSLEDGNLAFVVTDPNFFGLDYTFDIEDDVAEQLHLQSAEDVVALNIVRVPHDNPNKMTANLVAPIVINANTFEAAQIILNDTEYTTQTRLIPDDMLKQISKPDVPPQTSASVAEGEGTSC